jgi:hypothetical protein
MSTRKKSTELILDLIELKLALVHVKLERITKLVAAEYDTLIDRNVRKARTKHRIDAVSGKLNAHRARLHTRIEHDMVTALAQVTVSRTAANFDPATLKTLYKRLGYFRKQIEDGPLSPANLKWILLAEGVLGRLVRKRYNFVEFAKYNVFLSLHDSALNPSTLIKKRLHVTPVDFYWLASNDNVLIRYVDKTGGNRICVVDRRANLLYSRVYEGEVGVEGVPPPRWKYLSLTVDNDSTKIYVLYSKSSRKVRLDVFDHRLNLKKFYSFSKIRLDSTVTGSKRKCESFIWNFLVCKSELLVSYRVEVNGLFDLCYVLYELGETSMTLKSVIGDQSVRLAESEARPALSSNNSNHLPVNKMSCLVYFTDEFFYFINHDATFNRFLEIMYRFKDGRNFVLKKIRVDDSYSFFFDARAKRFVAYNTESGGLSGNDGDYMREAFKLCEYEFDGSCVYEDTRVDNLYDVIKFDHFKVYFKNTLNIGLTNLFREYFASKIF